VLARRQQVNGAQAPRPSSLSSSSPSPPAESPSSLPAPLTISPGFLEIAQQYQYLQQLHAIRTPEVTNLWDLFGRQHAAAAAAAAEAVAAYKRAK